MEFHVGDEVVFEPQNRTWKLGLRKGTVFYIISQMLLVIDTDKRHDKVVVESRNIVEHMLKEE